MEIYFLLAVAIICAVLALRKGMINSYKIGYYEQKLKNREVDISSVENMTLLDIWRL